MHIFFSEDINGRIHLIKLFQLLIFFLRFWIAVTSLYCFDHDIFRSMLQAGKFNHGNIISVRFQLETPQRVCQQLSETIFNDSMFEHRFVEIVADLTE